MALTNIEIVRLLIGDTESDNYILTDDQVDYYLTINNDDTDAAATDASLAISQILAIRAVSIRTEDMWEDSRDASKRYNESLSKVATLKGSASAYPIIGGCSEYRGAVIDQFDEENNYGDTDTFYNDGLEEI